MNETQITLTGNLVDNPELRFTPTGVAVARFRLASTPRYRDNASGEWKDDDTLFMTCQAWRQLAEHAAESLDKGTRVILTGRLRQRSYEAQDDSKRTVYEIEADEIGPSLRNATAKVEKVTRNGAEIASANDAWASEHQGAGEPPF
jgi:single-strand DNA-binding protein